MEQAVSREQKLLRLQERGFPTGWMPFPTLNQQCRSTWGNYTIVTFTLFLIHLSCSGLMLLVGHQARELLTIPIAATFNKISYCKQIMCQYSWSTA